VFNLGMLWPYPQTLELAVKACLGQTLLLMTIVRTITENLSLKHSSLFLCLRASIGSPSKPHSNKVGSRPQLRTLDLARSEYSHKSKLQARKFLQNWNLNKKFLCFRASASRPLEKFNKF
jgi:hypothetical protein